jgi:hypothetical protein
MPPTRQQCSTQIDTTPAHVIQVQPGSVICVRTADGRIATLTVISTDENFTEIADITVWQERSPDEPAASVTPSP